MTARNSAQINLRFQFNGMFIFRLSTYISSLHSRLGNEGIPQSTILTFVVVVAFLRKTN